MNKCHRLSCQNCQCGNEHKICRIAGQHTQSELKLLQANKLNKEE